MSDYDNVFADILNRITETGKRLAHLETFEQPVCDMHIWKENNQNITNAAYEQVTFSGQHYSYNYNAAGTDLDGFTAVLSGRYLVNAKIAFSSAAPAVNFRINQSNLYYYVVSENPANVGYVTLTAVLNLVAGDTVFIEANNGGDVNTLTITGSTNVLESFMQVSRF